MLNALIISRKKDIFRGIESVLVDNGIKTDWSDTGVEALSMLMEEPNDLIVVDENLPDMEGRTFIEQVIMTNPMINCVIASPRKTEKFHEVYEGLGILMHFPVVPGRKEAQKLIEHMKKIFIPQVKHSI